MDRQFLDAHIINEKENLNTFLESIHLKSLKNCLVM